MNSTDEVEIQKILQGMKPKQGTGHDGVNSWLLKKLSNFISLLMMFIHTIPGLRLVISMFLGCRVLAQRQFLHRN